jgi:hypothetical protein
VAVLIADTGYELYAACETVRDLELLYADLGVIEIESVVEPNCVADDIWWETVALVCIHWQTLLITAT